MRLLHFVVICAACVLANFSQQQDSPVVQMLVPGFVVDELPIRLSNQNNLRFAPDGTLMSLGYDGRIWRLRDSNGDGLEDVAEPFWTNATLSVPLGMAWSTKGLYVSSKGKVSRLEDTNGDGAADREEVVASGWPVTDVGSGGVDATAVTLDQSGNAFFGLLVADYSNAYRLRKRKDLSVQEIDWLKQQGRWHEPQPGNEEEEFSLYDLNSPRGTIQKWDARTSKLSTVATGIRVPVALAFNRAGDLFNTDQEGETWMPNGNPLDELNHIVTGRNYGFPPRHDRWLPNLKSDPAVIGFGPQHQSVCGLVFNEPHAAYGVTDDTVPLPAGPAQKLFGPAFWEGDALIAGESRGKIWRVRLTKNGESYLGRAQTIARLSMLTLDIAISPRGELYVCCHSGAPDWGTGPNGPGKIFRITYKEPGIPVPVAVWPSSGTDLHVTFDKPVDGGITNSAMLTNSAIEFGEYVSTGDRFEILKPPYAVVQQQDATPRARLAIRGARLDESGRELTLKTDPHPLAVRYALTLSGVNPPGRREGGATIDLDYDFTRSSQPLDRATSEIRRESWSQPVAWAPKALASGGTDSRAAEKPAGDWEHGRELFFAAEWQCARCHRVRGEGGIAGPDLSNLVHRDPASVLRDIREPSATIHPDYVTYRVTTTDGESTEGFVRSQTEAMVQLFDANGKESSWARKDIESLRPTELSLMPAGLLEGRKEGDVRDLLTFLLWQPPQRANEQNLLGSIVSTSTPKNEQEARPRRIVLVSSKQDHGPGQHDYPRWQTNWSGLIGQTFKGAVVESAWEWPSAAQFQDASVIVFYFWNHDWSEARLAQMDQHLKQGRGMVLLHSAIIADKDPEVLAERLGLSAQPGRTGYRHMPFFLRIDNKNHPVTLGFPDSIEMLDEPYWPLIGDPANVRVLASATVDGESRPLIWTKEKNGRVFASVLGHYTWTLDDPVFRALILRGIDWAAGAR